MELKDSGLGLQKKEDAEIFKKVFETHFKDLHGYAFILLREEQRAEEAVQQVFFKLWEKRESMKIHTSLKSYLYKSVYHACMDEIKREKHSASYRNHLRYAEKDSMQNLNPATGLEQKELEEKLSKALAELPERCLTIFRLNRFAGLKYEQVANELGISVKTVEKQMGKALKKIRKSLSEFLPLLIYLLWNF